MYELVSSWYLFRGRYLYDPWLTDRDTKVAQSEVTCPKLPADTEESQGRNPTVCRTRFLTTTTCTYRGVGKLLLFSVKSQIGSRYLGLPRPHSLHCLQFQVCPGRARKQPIHKEMSETGFQQNLIYKNRWWAGPGVDRFQGWFSCLPI